MEVYEKVRTYLVTHNLKQNAIAEKAGISNMMFQAMLEGKRTLYADDLRAICFALDVTPETFVDMKI